jgi:hypothetical protein
MRTNLATRLAMAMLVAVGTIALTTAPASAAPAAPAIAATVPCGEIPAAIASLEVRLEVTQDRLVHAGPAQKPALIKLIKKLIAQISDLEAQQRNCP